MLDDALHAGVELYLSISAHTDNVRRLLLHRIRTLREEHVDHLFGPLDAASKVVKETPIERPAPLLTRALKFVRKKVTAILEEQSKAPEEGFRKRLAQILT